ncbi:ankyrin repeat domain-containing protein, partial [Roseivirga sp. UBA1976]|uniref:ankyrin repeat domain-containing protein n=1 Tax=Roseivirga sp. UBA1976 TaxID=1947386 RepID=UPI00257C9FD9
KQTNLKRMKRTLLILQPTAFFLALLILGMGCSGQASNQTQEGDASSTKAPTQSIHDAVISGQADVVKQHIAAGTNLNAKDPFGGSTPLILAAVFGHDDIAKLLIEAKADLNIKNKEGSTALLTAAFFGRIEQVKLLLEAGADKAIKNAFGATALESVQAPFSELKPMYELIGGQLKPMGLTLDLKRIEAARPEIAKLLQ